MLTVLPMPASRSPGTLASHRTLVLNHNQETLGYPLSTLNGPDTLTGFFMERFEVLKWSNVWAHSPSRCQRLPSVVALRHYVEPIRLHMTPPMTLQHLFIRDRGLCQYTGNALRLGKPKPGEPLETYASIDHVVPRSASGANRWDNVVLASVAVNSRKQSLSVAEAGLCLLAEPWVPTGYDLLRLLLTEDRLQSLPEEWREFLQPENLNAAVAA